jgi:hypothetical protein
MKMKYYALCFEMLDLYILYFIGYKIAYIFGNNFYA